MGRRRTYSNAPGGAYQPGQLIMVWRDDYGIDVSRDFGDTWTKMEDSNGYRVDIKISPTGQYIALIDEVRGLRLSEDFGETFNTVKGAVIGIGGLYQSSQIGLFNSVKMSDDAKYILMTSDKTPYNTGVLLYAKGMFSALEFQDSVIRDFDISAEGKYICVSTNKGVQVSSDFGASFNRISKSGSSYKNKRGVVLMDAVSTPRKIFSFPTYDGSSFSKEELKTLADWIAYYYDRGAKNASISKDKTKLLVISESLWAYLSVDRGNNFYNLSGVPKCNHNSATALSNDGNLLMATIDNKLYFSSNAGNSFTVKTLPTPHIIKTLAINSGV